MDGTVVLRRAAPWAQVARGGAVASLLAAAALVARPGPASGLTWVPVALALVLLVLWAREALSPGGPAALTLDAEGLRDDAGHLLFRWQDVADAEVEVRHGAVDLFTERAALKDGREVAVDLSGLRTHPLEIHKAIRARVLEARGTLPPVVMIRERGREHLLAGRADAAAAAFSHALTVDPDDVPSLHGRGRAWAMLRDYERAESDFTEAIRRAPDHAASYLERGQLRMATSRPLLAIEDFSRVIELRPKDDVGYWMRAAAYAAAGHPERAAADRAAAPPSSEQRRG